MKKCVHCGANLRNQAIVCMKCGGLQQEEDSRPVLPKETKPEHPVVSLDPVEQEFPVIAKQHRIPASATPAHKLKTNRGLLKFILLSIITFGIYGIAVMEDVSMDINILAGRQDGKRTMSYCLVAFLFAPLTLGIVPLVWSHRLCARIRESLERRGIDYRFGPGTFWGWGFFGTLILVGPFIYTHKLLKAMNQLAEHYNING